MHTLKKTYQFVAALTLILFVSTIVLPTGLAAASLLHCDMEMSQVVDTCCVSSNLNDHQDEKKDTQDCEQQTFCEQAIGSGQSDVPTVIQSSKILIGAQLLEELQTIRQNKNHPPAVKDEPASLHYHPSIFLLNSSFLN